MPCSGRRNYRNCLDLTKQELRIALVRFEPLEGARLVSCDRCVDAIATSSMVVVEENEPADTEQAKRQCSVSKYIRRAVPGVDVDQIERIPLGCLIPVGSSGDHATECGECRASKRADTPAVRRAGDVR
eukprot:2252536-Prymnesium_polylepis.1